MMQSNRHLDFGVEETIGDMKMELLNAGHTPGSSQVLIEAEGKRILYTGDFNLEESKLLAGASMNYGDFDAVVIESTYAMQTTPNDSNWKKNSLKPAQTWLKQGELFLSLLSA